MSYTLETFLINLKTVEFRIVDLSNKKIYIFRFEYIKRKIQYNLYQLISLFTKLYHIRKVYKLFSLDSADKKKYKKVLKSFKAINL